MKFNIKRFTIVLLVFASCKAPAEVKISSSPMTVVSFNSICCGVRSDAFLKSFFEGFKSENKTRLYAMKVTGCGKEGEYKILFGTANLSPALNKKFNEALKSVVDNELKNNTGDQLGTITIEIAESVNTSHCRNKEEYF